jgi:hypothetical protein
LGTPQREHADRFGVLGLAVLMMKVLKGVENMRVMSLDSERVPKSPGENGAYVVS